MMIWAYGASGWITLVAEVNVGELAERYLNTIYFEAELVTE